MTHALINILIFKLVWYNILKQIEMDRQRKGEHLLEIMQW